MCNREELNFARKFDAVTAKNTEIHRGEIWFVDLGDVTEESRDVGKIRPCLVFQNDKWNNIDYATIGIVPLSSSPMYNCFEDDLIGVRLPGYTNYSILGFNRIKFVDRKFFKYRVAVVTQELMELVDNYMIRRLCNFESTIKPIVVEEPAKNNNVVEQQNNIEQSSDIDIEGCKNNFYKLFSANRITSTYIRSLSIATCKELVYLVDVLGVPFFKENGVEFDERVFNEAVKTAKRRIKAFSKTAE